MFSLLRQPRALTRAFSSTPSRSTDVSRVILVGRLGRDPEIRMTKGEKEYISYSVATTNYPPPPVGPDGIRPESTTTWHHILSFNPHSNNYLRNLQKGSHVYVEANLEVRDPDPAADPSTSQAQRQIFLRHGTYCIIHPPRLLDVCLRRYPIAPWSNPAD
ncbi:single-strand binding protein family-domain-containing protein [Russula ochroleuca]|uniref:Single-strand binding protein family-domain-containing protein n=1 Tax=Russula ochroleuca TaxID=152965 RepID=A0A9P5N325_9AGAM|nr:single-strand binding protein family-domain-containing protein [Russula ochroleuca]